MFHRVLTTIAAFLAVVGFCFVCSAIACYAGYTRACVIDLLPVKGDPVICERNPRTIRKN